MYDLNIIKKNGGCYVDSREVAEAVGKRHHNLLRDIAGYIETMCKVGAINFDYSDFFIPGTYRSEQNKEMPCYLISKMGCEMVANKLTGEKGVLFTAAYVAKFNEMEQAERGIAENVRRPRLGEYNAAARLVVRFMQKMGAGPARILDFLQNLYEPLGVPIDADDLADTPRAYTAKEIAAELGIYSIHGNPHALAVSCILNENLYIGEEHRIVTEADYGTYIILRTRYDDYALQAVREMLEDYGYPPKIHGVYRTYHVLYKK